MEENVKKKKKNIYMCVFVYYIYIIESPNCILETNTSL